MLELLWLEVEQVQGILWVLCVQPKASRTWFKLYYFNPTQASINDTYIVLATMPSPAGLTSVVSLPWPVIMYHIIVCIQVQVLLYWVVSVFWTHPSPLYVPWIIDFYIDQGLGWGLGSSDRILTGASKNIHSNLLHYNMNFNCFLLGMDNYGDQIIEIILLVPDYFFIFELGPGAKWFKARGELIQGQDSAPDKVYIWEPSPGHGLG